MTMRTSVLLFSLFGSSFFAPAQDPVTAYPNNYSIVLDNRAVQVLRVHYGPHEKLGVHDHSKNPTVYVYLNDAGPVRFQHIEKEAFALTRPPTAKGAFRISPGRLEEHTVENLGATSSDFLRVELKQVPLGRFKQAFRGPAPPTLSETRTSQEFKNPFVEVQRVVCVDASGCSVPPSERPSVLVSFTRFAAAKHEILDAGAVRWLAASEALTITPDHASPAHLLRILIPPAAK
jgi:hypothetical protein